MPVSILLADSNASFSGGLRSLLEKQEDFRIQGEAQSIRELTALAERVAPDVILMDISSSEFNNGELVERLTSKLRGTKIVAVSISPDREILSRMFKAGVSGYLLIDSMHDNLVQAIRSVCDNRCFLSPELTPLVMEDYVRRLNASQSPDFSALTRREKEILAKLADGRTSKEIAGDLFISVKTVENHRFQLMKKLDIHNVAELTKFAIRHGLTSL